MSGIDWRTKIEQAEGRAARDARERRGLGARLAAAEQRATEGEARAERLHAALVAVVDAQCDAEDVAQEALDVDAALTAPATQPDERAAAERAEVLDAAREVVREGDHAWREHADDIRALGSHMQYYVLPAISRLRHALLALDATDGAAKEEM